VLFAASWATAMPYRYLAIYQTVSPVKCEAHAPFRNIWFVICCSLPQQ